MISDPFGDVTRAELGILRMRALLAELGDPHLRVPTVHIAGSKGKGSTAAFIATAANSAGHRVGLYTSPHLHRFPERIAIDGQPLTESEFAAEAGRVADAAARLEERRPDAGEVSTFEFVTAMGFAAFARRGCDLAVIEVGLGGRYDATNVIEPVVSVITRIDLEHTAVLGATHAEITMQKAGIIKSGVPCVASPQVPAAAEAIARVAAEVGAPLLVGGRDWSWSGSWRSFDAVGPWGALRNLRLSVPGPHQVENACTALAALHVVDRGGLTVPAEAMRSGLANTRWPGRFEHLQVEDRDVVLDGAHTPAAASALVETWRELFPATAATVILGTGTDKDARGILQSLRPLIGHLIISRAQSPRAADPNWIAELARDLGIAHEVQPSVAAALASARARQFYPILVTGSLFVAGEAREALGIAAPDLIWHELNLRQGKVQTEQNRA